jgi:hypothetical protein
LPGAKIQDFVYFVPPFTLDGPKPGIKNVFIKTFFDEVEDVVPYVGFFQKRIHVRASRTAV